MRFPMVQPVTEMTKAALGARLASGANEYLDMFHDDAVFEFPFGIGGSVHIGVRPCGWTESSYCFDRLPGYCFDRLPGVLIFERHRQLGWRPACGMRLSRGRRAE